MVNSEKIESIGKEDFTANAITLRITNIYIYEYMYMNKYNSLQGKDPFSYFSSANNLTQ